MINKIKAELATLGNPVKAAFLPRFFKACPGGYAEGDIFIGVTVPEIRTVAKKYKDLSLAQIRKLLNSRVHEHRLTALLILTHIFLQSDEDKRNEIVQFYLNNLQYVNNWDLVDLSADKILGAYLIDKDKTILYELCDSGHLWSQRVAIMSTFFFIRNSMFDDTFRLAKRLLYHKHDLIHKAVGWMLREIGKRDRRAEERFLKQYYRHMPRTMLRYAIEKFDPEKRLLYLKGLV
ncbi:MAG TPA: DNA alkylation repair protein [Dissulfurispiraceae bacterium]|nr:DNA alkylation repair protein [Dissulfurispiraceae bacterium]